MPKHSLTLGIDVGDRHSNLCLLDTETGEVIEESRIATTPQAFERRFVGVEPMRVALEAGTHSPWISRVLGGCGHEVLVANARKLGLIYAEGRKNDRLDAENLARLEHASMLVCSRRSSIEERPRKPTWRSSARARRWSGRGPSSSTTCAGRSSPSVLACPSAAPRASTARSASTCPKRWRSRSIPSWRRSPP